MMNDMGAMMGGMTWGMGLSGLLVMVLLVLGIATLIRYLFFSVRQRDYHD